jgi:hypothetical protein
MPLYPGAYFVPIPWANADTYERSSFGSYLARKIILHTAVSNWRSLEGTFLDGDACSHFYVDKDGNVEQYIDTDWVSAADLEGNKRSISIETWDGGGIPGVPSSLQHVEWNSDQKLAIAKLMKWISAEHGIPLQLMPDSLPTTTGVGYHRLGIGANIVPGGEQWANDPGKICPGDAKIAQVPGVIALAALTTHWSGRPPLRIDGSLGKQTITRWQQIMGTYVDGVISKPSGLVKAVQQHLRTHTSFTTLVVDGYGIEQSGDIPGTQTVRALQEYLDMPPLYDSTGQPYYDGVLAPGNSSTVRGLQIRLNKGYF